MRNIGSGRGRDRGYMMNLSKVVCVENVIENKKSD